MSFRPSSILTVVVGWSVVVALPLTSGCAQLGLIFHEPASPSRAYHKSSPAAARLAAYAPETRPTASPRNPIRPPGASPETNLHKRRATHTQVVQKESKPNPPGNGASTPVPDKQPTREEPQEKPERVDQIARLPYTAPGLPYQQIGLLRGIAALAATPEALGEGSEFSQALVTTTEGAAGLAGLTAPATMTVQSLIVGRPGLQEGQATGLSFASRDANIFKARANPLSGPHGVCRELIAAGFSKDHATCARKFRHE